LNHTIIKILAFCRRIINKSGYKQYKKATYMYCVLEELEKIADEYKYMCDFFLEDVKYLRKIDKKIIELYMELNNFYAGVYSLYYKYDIKKVIELFRKRKFLVDGSLEMFKLKSERGCRLAHYLLVITQKIANLLALKMEMEI